MLEVDLRRALAEDELELTYQPLVCLADGRVLGLGGAAALAPSGSTARYRRRIASRLPRRSA